MFTCLEMVSRIICSFSFPGIEMMLTSLYLPRYSFLHLLKIGAIFALFLSLGTSPSCHYLSKINKCDHSEEWSWPVPSALRVHPNRSVALHTSNLFKCYIASPYSTEGIPCSCLSCGPQRPEIPEGKSYRQRSRWRGHWVPWPYPCLLPPDPLPHSAVSPYVS